MKSRQKSFDDLVAREARKIAIDSIELELAKQNLPLPKDSALEFHIEALLTTKPDILDLARERVRAKNDAYSEGLRAIGISPSIIQPPLNIEI